MNRKGKTNELYEILLRRGGEIKVKLRAGHNRVCNSRWRFGRDCHSCHHAVSPETSRIVGRNCKRHEFALSNRGQATVEFALVVFALLCVVLGLGAILSKADLGVFIDHAITASSHNITNSISGVLDVLQY